MAQNQVYLFLVFSLTGMVIGILFDFFRILRRTIKTSNIVIYIQDLLFWILAGILILYNIWYFNNGEIRTYLFLGIILGVFIYMFTLSDILIYLFSKLLYIFISFFKIPIKIINLIFSNIMLFIVTIFKNITKKFTIKKGNLENNGE